MKKVILVAFIVMSFNAMAIDLWVKGGVNQGQGSKKTTDTGYVAGLEISQGILGFLDLGVGAGYNGNLKFENSDSNGKNIAYDMLPVYGFAKFNILPMGIKPYVVARLGGNLVMNDSTDYAQGKTKAGNGAYGALGLGAEFFSTIQAEILYSVSEVKDNPTGRNNVELLSLTLGYNFF